MPCSRTHTARGLVLKEDDLAAIPVHKSQRTGWDRVIVLCLWGGCGSTVGRCHPAQLGMLAKVLAAAVAVAALASLGLATLPLSPHISGIEPPSQAAAAVLPTVLTVVGRAHTLMEDHLDVGRHYSWTIVEADDGDTFVIRNMPHDELYHGQRVHWSVQAAAPALLLSSASKAGSRMPTPDEYALTA